MQRISRSLGAMVAFVVLGVVLGAGRAAAQEFQIYGLRALGMGGAGVAAVRDASAIYWNPAVQGFFTRKDESLEAEYSPAGGTFHLQLGLRQHEELGSRIDRVTDLDIEGLTDDPRSFFFPDGTLDFSRAYEYGEIVDELTDFLVRNPGVSVLGQSGLLANYRNFGIGFMGLVEVGATVLPDLERIGITNDPAEQAELVQAFASYDGPLVANFFTQGEIEELIRDVLATNPALWTEDAARRYVHGADSHLSKSDGVGFPRGRIMHWTVLAARAVSGESFEDNESVFAGQGAAIGEVPLSFGYAITDYLAAGINVKFLYALTYATRIELAKVDEDGYIEEVLDNHRTDYNFGIDLALYARWQRLRAGLVARNVNAPKFKFAVPEGGTPAGLPTSFRLNPQVRLGLAYLLLDNLILTTDFDLTSNESFLGKIPGASGRVQKAHFGVEYTPWAPLSLRGGLYRNMRSGEIPVVLTAGLGLNLWSFHMDLGAAVSTSTDRVEGVEWPTEANVGLGFSLVF